MILHNNPTALIKQGNTLANPLFTDASGQLKTFDYVVANPPFSDKRWSTGLDPANDPFERFKHFGVPPAKQGDYAYLLHILRSLKSTGKGACILPHGVLFRGNAEAVILKNLVQRGYVKDIIGLPANLFYGTGIPACIIVLDKENAADRRSDELYLDEVERCDIYVGLFGGDYGFEDAEGVSPTEQEFALATRLHKPRLIFVKGADDRTKHPKMQALIRQAGRELIRRRFVTVAELIAAVYAALVQYLEDRELIRTGPFDAAPCPKATLTDLDPERMAWFLREARRARGFPLPEEATPEELLTHLNLLNDGRPSHAAVLLFGKQPQRFLISSEVKCAHFHGTEVAKPIPSYQVYKGTVFTLVDQAVDFVMSKINLRVGTRAAGPQAPVDYEIPREVVAEAIVNGVAHRDYASKGSVQVMLFADRLEVWNPGALPPSLTLEMLRERHGSVPGNPLLAEPLYLAKYIERMGTGTRDMIRRCREVGLPEPEFSVNDGFVTTLRRTGAAGTRPELRPELRPESLEVRVLTSLVSGPLSKAELSSRLGHREISGQLNKVIRLLLAEQNVEQTIPDKPTSRLQKYRLTDKGGAHLASLRKGNPAP